MKRRICNSCGSINNFPARYLLRDHSREAAMFQVYRICIDCGVRGQSYYFCVLCESPMTTTEEPLRLCGHCPRCGNKVICRAPIKKSLPPIIEAEMERLDRI